MTAVAADSNEVSEIPVSVLLSELITDEVFKEPTNIGESLLFGKKKFVEWKLERNRTIKHRDRRGIIDTYDSDSCFESGKNNSETIRNLLTTETFPSKYLVDSDDEDDTEAKSVLVVAPVRGIINSNEEEKKIDNSGGLCAPQQASLRTTKRPRKTKNLFGTQVATSHQQRWWKKEDEILRAIPSGASGIVGFLGRRVNLDRLVQRDAGPYSMLREWVRDNPDRDEPFLWASSSSSSSSSSQVARTPLHQQIRERAENRDTGGSSIHPNPISEPPTTVQPQKTVDMLQWLSADPLCRTSIPCYPMVEDIKQLKQKRKAKAMARRERRKRIAATRNKLRRMGIHV